MFSRLKHAITLVAFMIFAAVAVAEEVAGNTAVTGEPVDQTPHQLVESITGELLKSIGQHRASFDTDPEPFFSELDCLLGRVVDFRWIAMNVMGAYRAQATDEQLQRFAKAFRRDLIETYGRGLVSYGDETIVVLPPESDLAGQRKVTVAQEIRGVDGVFPLYYSMAQNKEGVWKITNVVINGINLGKTFRNQFTQRAQKFGGNLDQVIDSWTSKAETEA
ncbi:MAG: ABC transporter substrate-binding protein [Porticoccaceae bacterium]